MRKKRSKIGQPSSRKGGPYTQKEIDLWKKIEDRTGQKRHVFIRANKGTNKVEVFEQDEFGKLKEKIDEFKIDDRK